jgi:hypothetical protein
VHERDVEIPEPCHADWDTMRPEDRGRFCFQCQNKVHDLSAMTERDAKRFLADAADGDADVCVSYLAHTDGSIDFVAPKVLPIGRLLRFVPAAGLAMAAAACTPTEPPAASHPTVELRDDIEATSPAQVEVPEAASVLTHPMQAVANPPAPPREVDQDIPCDGSMSHPDDPPPEVAPVLTRTAGTPVVRRRGGLRRRP